MEPRCPVSRIKGERFNEQKKAGQCPAFLWLCCADQRLTAQTTFFMAVM
jgi:carbonic anhydrase